MCQYFAEIRNVWYLMCVFLRGRSLYFYVSTQLDTATLLYNFTQDLCIVSC